MAFLQQIFPLSSPHLKDTSLTHEKTDLSISAVADLAGQCGYNRVVITGPDRADKTSLVFQAAVSAAAAGENITYICTHPLKRLPTQVHGMMAPEASTMRNIDFLYFEEANELISWCAKIHTKADLPSLIVVEDVLAYAMQMNDKNLERGLARLCATIADTTTWIASNSDIKKCQILMTAPARIASLNSVLAQFDFRIATYKGPGPDEPCSQLSYETHDVNVSIKFHHMKDSIFMTDVQASKITSL